MAAPTPTTKSGQSGHTGYSIWYATWANTDDHSDHAVVDLSGLTSYTTSLKITKGHIVASSGISVMLELDASTDIPIALHPTGASGRIDFDFENIPGGGISSASGDTGDLLLTTTSCASGDMVYVYVEWKAY